MNWYKRKKNADNAHNLYEYLCEHPVQLSEEDIFNPNIEPPVGFHVDQVAPGMWAGFAPAEADDIMLVAPEPVRENAKTLMKRRIFYVIKDLVDNHRCDIAI